MRYEFECPECGQMEEFFNSIHDGPPGEVSCAHCEVLMHHNMGGNFVLKGDGWAGKDMKKSESATVQAKEESEHQIAEDKRNQRIVDEVTKTRRKGSRATQMLESSQPQKMKDYQEAIKKGYRAEGKSYQVKKIDE